MESLENKIIQEKISSLDVLPQGYEPSLVNKWELIEAGLEGKKKKRPVFYWSVAAALLFTTGLWWMQVKFPATNSTMAVNTNTGKKMVSAIKEIPVQQVNKEANRQGQKAKGRIKKTKAEQIIPILTDDKNGEVQTLAKPVLQEENKVEKIVAVPIKKSKPKMMELDFNDTLTAQTWVVAGNSTKAKFKIGIGSMAKSSKGNGTAGSLLKLHTTL